ncbi:unnamed protein product [Fraxinus pennsylvanica]|uniref:Uncharacterized protein n=1 Tax=Fraxinus pennsylvanica TaxID=56036 RepID=A0AAD2DUR0_9LAMI|nr:unnamed protein product [Fraxinus pennsylvanica]
MTASGARNIRLPLMNLVRLKGVTILQQLHLEDRLLRKSSDNWCIINDGTYDLTIVMGISGKHVELLEIDSVLQDEIPVIRRFTGGGREAETLIISSCNSKAYGSQRISLRHSGIRESEVDDCPLIYFEAYRSERILLKYLGRKDSEAYRNGFSLFRSIYVGGNPKFRYFS